ncbi:beta-N-acetylhexosaminidase [Flavitalea sp. BT771]|uniref:beta-N-acetylhexosaminidase n=1 Tax=Flavitalea sp. BT771 TaxID=3063329 RepID=UPI0026E3359B|nr:beta-N-acetylhexosaminidase [Flavitalea sp. BT771]MDO6429451.1 beta-N-acetylhexosaminidase [Flavitalea sp. BT771]MDV6218421.1 beta-N-acetylhexosaminidase [Flavitalea sp. BT771]
MRLFQRISILALSLITIGRLSAQHIIPYPLKVETKPGKFTLNPSTSILYTSTCRQEASFLHDLLDQDYHLRIATAPISSKARSNAISLSLDASLAASLGNEGYDLTVDEGRIQARAATSAGIFYAIQTLRQLITSGATIPACHISDKPRFAWRSFMLDEGRYFKGEAVVKQLLDEMAYLKMNIFHWHLTDDHGWRIEIKKYPLLTAIGSKRDSSQMGVWPSGWGSKVYDGIPHQGYYTQQQIKDILRYAAARHITVVPEIEMPGHASAAIAAYPFLGAEGKQIKVPVKFGVQDDIYNVADTKVLAFIHDVLGEVMALFPSRVIHIGGDEVRYGQWKNAPQVMDYIRQQGLASPADLQISFTNGISNFLEGHHRRMMGWNEILGGKVHEFNDLRDTAASQQLSRQAIIQFWKGDVSLITKAAAAGYDIVNSWSDYTYLDYDAKGISLEKAYGFEPVPADLPQRDTARILGLGCQMWGEWIPSVERMNEKVYPRLAAYAEVGWTSRLNKDLQRFTATIPALEARWTSKGYMH